MDHDIASEKLRALATELATEIVLDAPASTPQSLDRVVVVFLLTAYFDAVRAEWEHWCDENPQLKAQIAIAKELMRDAGYGDMDPICGLPGVEPMVAGVDGRKAVSFEHSMSNVMPLSAIFLNKVKEVMDAADKVAAASAVKKPAEPPSGESPPTRGGTC